MIELDPRPEHLDLDNFELVAEFTQPGFHGHTLNSQEICLPD